MRHSESAIAVLLIMATRVRTKRELAFRLQFLANTYLHLSFCLQTSEYMNCKSSENPHPLPSHREFQYTFLSTPVTPLPHHQPYNPLSNQLRDSLPSQYMSGTAMFLYPKSQIHSQQTCRTTRTDAVPSPEPIAVANHILILIHVLISSIPSLINPCHATIITSTRPAPFSSLLYF